MKFSLYALLFIVTGSLFAFQSLEEERAKKIRDCKRFRDVILQFEKSYAKNLQDIDYYHGVCNCDKIHPLATIALLPISIPWHIWYDLISSYYSQENNNKREFENSQRIKDIAHYREKLKEDYCTSVEEHQE